MPLLLAIDTATRTLSLALHDGQHIRAETTWETANAHTVELAPAVATLLTRANVTVRDLTQLAIAQGPGSFSGLRIGIGYAKGLAFALAIPLIAVPTLDIVAGAQPMFKGDLIAVAQVGRGRICAGRYQWRQGAWDADGDVQIMTWTALLDTIHDEVLIAGEIDAAGQELIDQSDRRLRLATPAARLRRASVLADLAWERAELPADPIGVVPLYVNQPGLPHP